MARNKLSGFEIQELRTRTLNMSDEEQIVTAMNLKTAILLDEIERRVQSTEDIIRNAKEIVGMMSEDMGLEEKREAVKKLREALHMKGGR